MYYAEACNDFARPISALLRPGNTAPFEQMSQRWWTVGNSVSDLTGPKLEPQISCSRDERVTASPIDGSEFPCIKWFRKTGTCMNLFFGKQSTSQFQKFQILRAISLRFLDHQECLIEKEFLMRRFCSKKTPLVISKTSEQRVVFYFFLKLKMMKCVVLWYTVNLPLKFAQNFRKFLI